VLFVYKSLSGIPQIKGGEKRSLGLNINVRREFIAYPSKAVLVSDSVYKNVSGIPQGAVRNES
jgi:hypothetical protein